MSVRFLGLGPIAICWCLLALPTAARAQVRPRLILTCGTPSGQQVSCTTDGYATGVRLTRDLSAGRCRQGQSWGFTDSFVWANKGCRAEFEVTYRATPGTDGTGNRVITCATPGVRPVSCKTEGDAISVAIVRDLTGAGRCVQGQSWGWNNSLVWVNGGCQGEFRVTYRGGTVGRLPGQVVTRVITCGTPTGEQVSCKTDGEAGTVRLTRDLSGGRCRQGQNWGFTNSFIWANKGCRADFEVTYRGWPQPYP